MKRVFKFKKDELFDGDHNIMYTIYDMLIDKDDGADGRIMDNYKITIIRETIK